MESLFSRYRNEWVLLGVLFVQVLALATQVRVPRAGQSGIETAPRMIRVWASGIMYPFQKVFVGTGGGIRSLWANYIDLRGVRQENEELRRQLEEERLRQVKIQQDAEQGLRLQALVDFKKQFINRTLAAQVIGTSGTDLARVIYVDRGASDGVAAGMAVITPDGIVGKVSRADRFTSQVLLISDPQSGAGVILERLRLNGVLKGSTAGNPEVLNVMADEKIEVGDRIITTGGDHIFPKGLTVGSVESTNPDPEREPYLKVKVKPAVNLGKLEEVLVVTELATVPASALAGESGSVRAADLLAERLPKVPKKPEAVKKKEEAVVARRQTSTETVPQGVDTSARIVPEAKTTPAGTTSPPVTSAPAQPSPENAAVPPPSEDKPR